MADAVVLAAPGYSCARLLVDSVPAAAAELGSIPYAPVVLVTLAWPVGLDLPSPERKRLPRATPARAGSSPAARSCPPSGRTRAAPGEVVLRASTGRYGDERSSSMSDEELLARVTRGASGARRRLGDRRSPAAVQRWPRAFPQYLPGTPSQDRAGARRRSPSVPRIELAGAAARRDRDPGCVTSGERAAVSGPRSPERHDAQRAGCCWRSPRSQGARSSGSRLPPFGLVAARHRRRGASLPRACGVDPRAAGRRAGMLAGIGQLAIGLAWAVKFTLLGYLALVVIESAMFAARLRARPERAGSRAGAGWRC